MSNLISKLIGHLKVLIQLLLLSTLENKATNLYRLTAYIWYTEEGVCANSHHLMFFLFLPSKSDVSEKMQEKAWTQ